MAKRIEWKAQVGDLIIAPCEHRLVTYDGNGVQRVLDSIPAGTVGVVTERVRRKREGFWANYYTVQYGSFTDFECMETALNPLKKD